MAVKLARLAEQLESKLDRLTTAERQQLAARLQRLTDNLASRTGKLDDPQDVDDW